MKQHYFRLTPVVLLACSALANAEHYQSGITTWPVKEGKMVLVAGVLTDNSRLYYLNYSFFFEEPDKTLVVIPIVKEKANLNDYSLSFSTFNGGDDVIADAMLVVNRDNTWLITAHKDAVRGYDRPGRIATQTYRLFHGEEVQWKYYFSPVHKGEYAEKENYTIERALSETAKTLN